MGEELITKQDADKLKEHRQKMQNFMWACHQNPEKISKDQKVPYIPISYLETKMDEIFFGEWDLTVDSYQIIANSLAVSVTVTAKCPVSGQKIKRGGIGAVPIRLNKGSMPTDFSQIQSDSIKTGLPAAKAYAFKNAVQSIGKVFGRDLARNEDKVDTYNPIIDNDENPELIQELKKKYMSIEHSQENIDSILFEAKKNCSKKEINDLRAFMIKNNKGAKK